MATVKDILLVKGPRVLSIGPEATALDAARLMNEHKVGALLVMDGDHIRRRATAGRLGCGRG